MTNFSSEFHLHELSLGEHPSRIWQEPVTPDDLTEEQAQAARIVAEWNDRLIVFVFNDRSGFIEPLPDYDDRRARLCSGTERDLITAVVVGETDDGIINPYEEHFQLNVLRALGFVTGAAVGTDRMEFRDAAGTLVSRCHSVHGEKGFSEAVPLQRSRSLHVGTGRLLNNLLLLPEEIRSRARSATKQCIQSGLHSSTTEDRLSHLFRGLEGVFEFHGLCLALDLSLPWAARER